MAKTLHFQENHRVTEKVIIIGSGPAAWTAAIYAARADLHPLVLEGAVTEDNRLAGTLPLGQLALTTEIENYPGFPAGDLSEYLDRAIAPERRQYMAPHDQRGVSGPELMDLMRQQAVNFGTRIVTADVAEVDFDARPFRLADSDGKRYASHAVIVATGARANYLGLPSEEKYKNRGVSACAICDGALPRFRNKPLAVVGGGDSAVEEADYLSKFASEVYLIHRRTELRASKIMQQRAFANAKVAVLLDGEVSEIVGDDRHGVTGVRFKRLPRIRRADGSLGSFQEWYRTREARDEANTLGVSGYFAAIGHTPNTAFLNGKLALTEKKYIRWTTPSRTCTSVEGVFAAGDVADDYYRQAVTAAGSGCMAALDAERWLAAN
jgi:thioredoxin reductase (NADPH)